MQFGPGFLPTFLYYFTGTAIIFTLLASKGLGLSLSTGVPEQLGILGGLVAGTLGAYLNQTTTFSVQFRDRQKFFRELETTLNQLGYEQTAEEDGLRVYERSSARKLFSGKVYVQLEGNSATLGSRASIVRRLRKGLS
jgi:hypothetical protein